jgi:hypothetical protein
LKHTCSWELKDPLQPHTPLQDATLSRNHALRNTIERFMVDNQDVADRLVQLDARVQAARKGGGDERMRSWLCRFLATSCVIRSAQTMEWCTVSCSCGYAPLLPCTTLLPHELLPELLPCPAPSHTAWIANDAERRAIVAWIKDLRDWQGQPVVSPQMTDPASSARNAPRVRRPMTDQLEECPQLKAEIEQVRLNQRTSELLQEDL